MEIKWLYVIANRLIANLSHRLTGYLIVFYFTIYWHDVLAVFPFYFNKRIFIYLENNQDIHEQ